MRCAESGRRSGAHSSSVFHFDGTSSLAHSRSVPTRRHSSARADTPSPRCAVASWARTVALARAFALGCPERTLVRQVHLEVLEEDARLHALALDQAGARHGNRPVPLETAPAARRATGKCNSRSPRMLDERRGRALATIPIRSRVHEGNGTRGRRIAGPAGPPLTENIVAASSPAAVIDGAGQFSDRLVCGAFCSVGEHARGEETDDRTRRSERHRWVTLQSQRSGRQWRHDSCVLSRSKRLVKKF